MSDTKLEEKLDRVIELLEAQQKSLDRMVNIQTTNNLQNKWTKPTPPAMPSFGMSPPPFPGMGPGEGPSWDTKSIIEEAKRKALKAMQQPEKKEAVVEEEG